MHTQLSKREKVVLEGIMSGRRLKAIANEAGLKQSTIGTYKRRLMVKLGTDNIIELRNLYVAYLNENNLVCPDKEGIAVQSFIALFGEDDIDLLYSVKNNPRTYHRLIVEKYARLCDPTKENTSQLNHILDWVCEVYNPFNQ
jgi:DNA-binding CsgD family transcriptional regulator